MRSNGSKRQWDCNQPIVAADNLLLKCHMKGESYIPEAVLPLDRIIGAMQEELKNKEENLYSNSSNPLRKISTSFDKSNKKIAVRRSNSSILINITSECTHDDHNVSRSDNHEKLINRFNDDIDWMAENEQDYVAMETFESLTELQLFLKVIVNYSRPIALRIRRNEDGFVVLYQWIEQFRHEFMMVRLGNDYCLFMEPF